MQENAVPNIFKSVSYAENILTATDESDNVVLEIMNGGGGYFRAYRGESNFIGLSNIVEFPGSAKTIDVIGCDNGFIIQCSVTWRPTSANIAKPFAALFSKTNNSKVAIIFPSNLQNGQANDEYTKQLNHVAFGDSATMSTTTTFTPESGNQTNFCTFCTNADITDVSYTPKAFYLPMHSAYNSGIGKFLSGGKVYITNGYWAIDTEQTEEDAT
jgi:hypothetical protein